MLKHPSLAPPLESMTTRTLRRLQAKLGESVGLPPAEFGPTKKIETMIPPKERRRVWTELAEAGYPLPSSGLSVLFLIASFVALIPLSVLAFVSKAWAFFFFLPELSLLVRKIARWLAAHLPKGLTVYEAALGLTPFRREDYELGLWPPEEIGDKVRLVISNSVGVPFDSIRGETRLADL
jgi:hypothetical protein